MQAGQACSVLGMASTPPPEDSRERERSPLWEDLQQQILQAEMKDAEEFRALFEMQEMVIAQKVRQLRTERGRSQEDIAERMTHLGWPMHQTTIAKLEAGSARRAPVRRTPSPSCSGCPFRRSGTSTPASPGH